MPTPSPSAPMELDRALEINGACCAHHFFQMRFTTDQPPSLAGVDLLDMLIARYMVSEENKRLEEAATHAGAPYSTHMVCDPRFIAALYVAYTHEGQSPREAEAVAIGNGNGVLVISAAKAKALNEERVQS